MMIRHLFKNFWLSFNRRNSLQVLGLFLMLGIIITLFLGDDCVNQFKYGSISIDW